MRSRAKASLNAAPCPGLYWAPVTASRNTRTNRTFTAYDVDLITMPVDVDTGTPTVPDTVACTGEPT